MKSPPNIRNPKMHMDNLLDTLALGAPTPVPLQQEAVRPGRPTKLDPIRAPFTDHIAGL